MRAKGFLPGGLVDVCPAVLQRHTARAFWHLASMEEGPAAEAAVVPDSLAALLRLAAPEGEPAAQTARQALRRLCEDPAVRDPPSDMRLDRLCVPLLGHTAGIASV